MGDENLLLTDVTKTPNDGMDLNQQTVRWFCKRQRLYNSSSETNLLQVRLLNHSSTWYSQANKIPSGAIKRNAWVASLESNIY